MKEGFADSFGMRLRRAYHALHRRTNAELRRRFNVTADQFVVLNLLAEGDCASQQELCARCYSDPSTMGALVRLMETHGWVRREPDKADARARRVRLTPKGRALQKKLWEAASEGFHGQLWAVPRTAREERVLLKALDRVVSAMEEGADS